MNGSALQLGWLIARRALAMYASIRTRSQRVSTLSLRPMSWADIYALVYAPDMPRSLPPLLVVRRLAQQFLFIIIFSIRAVLVACIWLAVLPLITVWTWRAYFAMGESAYVSCSSYPIPTLTCYQRILGGRPPKTVDRITLSPTVQLHHTAQLRVLQLDYDPIHHGHHSPGLDSHIKRHIHGSNHRSTYRPHLCSSLLATRVGLAKRSARVIRRSYGRAAPCGGSCATAWS